MKKIATLMIALTPMLALAQKEIKPSVAKAEKALMDKKLDEAKSIIDVTVNNKEYMVDKKGKPSKNAAESWFIRGVIYASIDTSKDEKIKSLASDPYDTALKSFDREKALNKDQTKFYLKDQKQFLPILNSNVMANFSQAYFLASTNAYNKAKDYKAAFANMEKAIYFVPEKDTAIVLYAGVYFGPAAEEYDKSIKYMNQYIERGGNDPQAYQQLINVLLEKKKDNAAAITVIRKAEAKWPKNDEFPKYELNLYLGEKKYKEAARIVKEQIHSNPNDGATYYMLGQLYDRTNNPDSARIAFQKAIDLDPTNFEANLEVAKSYFLEGKKIKQQRDRLGISAPEIAQRKTLLEKQRAEYQIALPYWEKLEKLKPEDEDVLFTLSDIYNTLVMDDQVTRIDKKIKALGLDK